MKEIRLTDAERALARTLRPGGVTYPPGSADKRFARFISAAAEQPEATITPKQREYLLRLARRYRRQLSGTVLQAAGVEP